MASRLTKAMIALLLTGAGAGALTDQFLTEKEGNKLVAYKDGAGIWTICRGLTRVDGRPVTKGMALTAEQCDTLNAIEAKKSIDWVKKNVRVQLSEPQIAAVASFCHYNLGPTKCMESTFWAKLNTGNVTGACTEIKKWVRDGGKDCRLRDSGCYGQVIRRDQEAELLCWGL